MTAAMCETTSMVFMTALWIAAARDDDAEPDTIHVLVTDGGDQCRFVLRRSEQVALYDFIVAHRREPGT
jgi:hypothetical protein